MDQWRRCISAKVDKDNAALACVSLRSYGTQLEILSVLFIVNLIDMGTEPFIMGWNEGPEKQELEKKPDRIALACPFPGCHLAFLHLNALRAHANQKHGLQIKMSNCALKVDGLKRLQRPQGYQGKRESLRSYHQKDRITAPPCLLYTSPSPRDS